MSDYYLIGGEDVGGGCTTRQWLLDRDEPGFLYDPSDIRRMDECNHRLQVKLDSMTERAAYFEKLAGHQHEALLQWARRYDDLIAEIDRLLAGAE